MGKEKRQRQKAAKAARIQAEQKRKSRKENFRRLGIGVGMAVVLVGVLVVCNLGGDDEPEEGVLTAEVSGTYREYRDKPTACGAEQPPALQPLVFTGFEPQGIAPGTVVTARVKTSCGEVVIELDPSYPETVNSFVFLARQGFYDGSVFHRILEGFVVQGGDPQADGRGDAGYEIADEYPPEDFQYTRGVVAMANAGKGTTGSQFFWMLDDAPFLNPQYNVLGRITGGMEVLDLIARIPTSLSPTGEKSLPREALYIESVEIIVGS